MDESVMLRRSCWTQIKLPESSARSRMLFCPTFPIHSSPMRTTSLLLALILMPSVLLAADSPPAKKIPGVSDQMKSFIDKHEISGAVTLVADKDGIIHLDAVGLADIA